MDQEPGSILTSLQILDINIVELKESLRAQQNLIDLLLNQPSKPPDTNNNEQIDKIMKEITSIGKRIESIEDVQSEIKETSKTHADIASTNRTNLDTIKSHSDSTVQLHRSNSHI